MNILYDISPLGFVHENSLHKTGIPRVIEELAYQLAEMPECHLELCSNEFFLGAVDYAKTEARLKSVRFASNRFDTFLQRNMRDTQRVIDAGPGPPRVAARTKRKALHLLASAARSSLETLASDSLRTADIYHSTFTFLPEIAKSAKRPRLFLTVYDLIPVLYPQYCDAGVSDGFHKIMASIDKDSWVLCISEATKADLCSYLKLDPRRVFVTPLAADATLFYPGSADEQARVKEEYHIPAGPYVLSLCTIEPRKNIDHVIRSFVKLRQEQPLPDLSLVLAGAKGWNYDHIFQEIAGAEALKDSIVVTGFVANEDLAGLYSGALAFVFPSLYEGFGLPPLEAMQCGTPVITSNTSSLPEVVGEAGIMLDPKDVDGLCQSLLSLYRDAGLRAQMSAASLVRAKEFSWKRCAEETVQAYRTALAS